MEFRETLGRANSLVERATGKLSLDALLRRALRLESTPVGSLSPETP